MERIRFHSTSSYACVPAERSINTKARVLRYRGWVNVQVSAEPAARVWSPDARTAFRPATTYQDLAQDPGGAGKSILLRRPLFLALFLACMVSLIASQRLTLRLLVTGTINMSFIPLVEILGLRAVWQRERGLSFSRAVDYFFMGHGPWIGWLLAYALIWALASPDHAFFWTAPRYLWPTFVLAILWSGFIDYCFYRRMFYRNRGEAAVDLLLQRAISWTLGILIFGLDPLAPELTRILHL